MLWPRGNLIFMSPGTFSGNVTRLPRSVPAGERMNATLAFPATASVPSGYGMYILPRKGGGMSSWQARFDLTGTGSLLQGGPLTGTANLTFATAGDMSLVISLAGTGTATFAPTGNLALTIGLGGDGAFGLSGSSGLSMIIPIDGAGAFGLSGSAALRGDLSMAGSWGGAEALSPAGLAAAVWGSTAASNNTVGTMGALLNASGAAGDPWSVTLEGTYTAADLVRLMSAALAGKISGAGTPTVTIRDVSDTANRIVATVDANGNRTAVTTSV
jgi:hypothetical protein